MKREICNVVTKGTFMTGIQGEPRYVLAVKRHGLTLGVTFFDVSTLKFYTGQFEDDETFSMFRTLICQLRPTEILHERELA